MSRALVTSRTFALSALATSALLLVVSFVSSGSAQAMFTHPYTGESFGPTGAGSGLFSSVEGVTVDQANSDVFVYDAGFGGRVYKFNLSGEPVNFSATATNWISGVGGGGMAENEIAVDESSGPDAGDIYVANKKAVLIYAANGAFLEELSGGEMCGVAVDPSGSVYVGIYPETVRKYTPVTNPVNNGDETASMAGLHQVCNVAADNMGDIYAAAYGGGIVRYEALQFGSLAASGTTIDEHGRTLAVDSSSGHLYANTGFGVEEYDSSGSLLDVSGGGEGEIEGSSGIGVSASGRLYVQSGGRVKIFGVAAIVPDVSVEAAGVSPTTVTLKGTVNPDGVVVTTCEFEYGPVGQGYPSHVPCSSLPGSGSVSVEVGASLGGLTDDTEYHYRLAAGNVNGTNRGTQMTFTTPGPGIRSEAYSQIGTRSATVTVGINPNGQSTTVMVEYGTTMSYGSLTREALVGAGTEVVHAPVTLEGLQPDTTYHARAVVTNQSGGVIGTDITFTTYALADLGLPDGRAYEKVSPNDNADGNVYPNEQAEFHDGEAFAFTTTRPFVAAENGNGITYTAAPPEKGGNGRGGASAGDQYLATRAPNGGWSAHNVSPYSGSPIDEPHYEGFSPDLTAGFLVDNKHNPLVVGAPAGGYLLLYENLLGTETLEPLITVAPPNRNREEFQATYAGSSSDAKHVLYLANDALTTNAVDAGSEEDNLYDWHEGALSLVNVLPDGTPEPNAMFGGPSLPGSESLGQRPEWSNVMSEDGQRVFWTGLGTHDLYMREDDERTVQIDAGVGGGGQFWTASPDGSKVLFTKGSDLYEYDVEDTQTADLVPGGEVQDVIGTSTDLSYIYFIAGGALAPGGEQQACSASDCNLYVLHVGEPVRFISKLAAKDKSASPEGGASHSATGAWAEGLARLEAQVTPDGRHLVFGSVLSLTGYETSGREEIYVYDYEDAHLNCASCDPTGSASPFLFIGAYLPVSHMNTHLPRWMSADGNQVFFDSVQALVPQDTNGANDVYEWERDGSGSCTKSTGCIYLLSGGTSVEGSFFIEAGASGRDVFIATREQLLAEDGNENFDIYDAREGAVPPPVAPQCTGTGCQGIPSAPPVFSTPSSVTYNGVGNFAPPAGTASKAKPKLAAKDKKTNKAKKSKRKKAGRRHGQQDHGASGATVAGRKHAKSDRRGK